MLIAEIPELGSWTRQSLAAAGFMTLQQAVAMTDAELMEIQGVGEQTIRKLRGIAATIKSVETKEATATKTESLALTLLLTLVSKHGKALDDFVLAAWSTARSFYGNA